MTSGVYQRTEETKRKIALTNTLMWKNGFSERRKRAMAEGLKKKWQDPNFRKKMSERITGEKNPNFGKFGTANPKFGCHLSEETKQKLRLANLGKHPSEETRMKISESKKGHIGYMLGKHHSEETKNKIAKAHTGKPSGALGYHHLKEAKERMSKKHQVLWQNPEFAERLVKSIMLGNNVKPNKPERALIEFFVVNNLPYRFVGNGEVIIGNKCPDFINTNGEKKLVLLHGDYWHSQKITGRTGEKEEVFWIQHYARYGFHCLQVWEHELKDTNLIKQKVMKFDKK